MDRTFGPCVNGCGFPRALPLAGMDAGLWPSVGFVPSSELSSALVTATVRRMKAPALKDGRFVTDAKGKTVGVLLDLKTYERLCEAEEDLADIRAYDTARPKVLAEVKAMQVASLADYRARRLRSK